MEGNMKYYVDVWFVLMCVTLILIPVASHFKKNSLTLLAGANVIGMISMIIWATTPHYYNMEVEAIYTSLLIFFTMFFGVKEKFNLDDVALLVFGVCITCCTVFFFSKENYKQWYEDNFYKEVQFDGPEVTRYEIPDETSKVRFPYGLEYYQLTVCKQTIGGEYLIQFFAKTHDEPFDLGDYYSLIEDYARHVKLIIKMNSEKSDHAIRYAYWVDLVDVNTGEVISTYPYYDYEFYVPLEVAKRYYLERKNQ